MTTFDPASLESSEERSARLRAMGAVLDDATDETDEGWGRAPSGAADLNDAALRRDVPPHHGG
uniref:Chromosome (Plasmid) partitioning protein ParB n=1 Tax=uncultured Nocardioidaceae bacterium TaxID=253824 RepID=A0A6J4M6W4_9ACTN|nr:MAG: Chromosome (plasmid) partitioning protein ParB [uncultured Nocardioidaceae bacterium]